MSDIGIRVSRAALSLFRSGGILSAAIAALADGAELQTDALRIAQISGLNVAAELAEKTGAVKYPLIYLYCERAINEQREKFRRFSGRVLLTAEARVSQSRMDGIQSKSQVLADAITEVLDSVRGNWAEGMFYGGRYEIIYGPVKPGGKNFVQVTKVTFEVIASAD
jgi:hypothetical protein